MNGSIHAHLGEGGICKKCYDFAIVFLISLRSTLSFKNLYYKKNKVLKLSIDNT